MTRTWCPMIVLILASERPSGLGACLGDEGSGVAESEPLVTDRPDFTESPETVPPARVQLEGGVTFTYDHESPGRSSAYSAPELLLRVGIVERFEIRVGWEGYTWMQERLPEQTQSGRTVYRDEWNQGASDLYLGAKWKIWEQNGLRPHFSVIPAITVPSGTIGFSSRDVDPEVKLAWSYDLAESVALSGNVNAEVPSDEKGHFFRAGASVSLGVGLTDAVGCYLEYFGSYPNSRDSDCSHSLNVGLTWQITEGFQLDWRAGLGLNEEADDFFTGAGFGIRF